MVLQIFHRQSSPAAFIGFLLAAIAACGADVVPTGKSDFVFADEHGNADKPIRVWLFRPAKFTSTAPILFVMHGTLRNGETYREPWVPLAGESGALVVVPEFGLDHYRDTRTYQFGNMRSKNGESIAEDKWTFAAIEHLFDHLKTSTGSQREQYYLFGHSAGAQFVHRMVLFQRKNRIALAVTANAGSYTLPDHSVAFPFGLKDSGLADEGLKAALQVPLLILLGEKDIDTNDKYLPKNPGAIAQGPTRLARGHCFFESAEAASQRLDTPLRWTKQIVPGVGHDNSRMAPVAAKLMFETNRKP